MRQSLTFNQASALIRVTAHNHGDSRNVRQWINAAKGAGIVTARGFLHSCGQRWFLTDACHCVQGGQPLLTCRDCQGTGKA